jgi:hypothetical protein
MTVSSETRVEVDGWEVKDLFEDGEHSHYVLKKKKEGVSIPFDEVHASGGLLNLDYNDERSATFSGVIDGKNKYTEDANMPKEVFFDLKNIGPY